MLTLLLLVFGTGIFYILSLANNIFFYFSILNDVEAFTNFQYLSRYCNNITSSFQRLLVRGTDKIISRVLVVIVVEPFHFGPAPASQDHKDGGFGSSSSPVVYNLLLNKKLPYKRVTPNRGGNSEFSSNFFKFLLQSNPCRYHVVFKF